MNDYLWDKSGEDPEIEALEESLSQFRYGRLNESQPMPPGVVATRPLTRLLGIGMIPACAAVVITAVWLLYAPQTDLAPKRETYRETAQRYSVDASVPVPKEEIAENPLAGKSPAKRKFVRKSSSRTIFKRKRPVSRRARMPARAERAKPLPALTREEEHAYQELMRALLITSSKLKLVKDKVDGPGVASAGKTKE